MAACLAGSATQPQPAPLLLAPLALLALLALLASGAATAAEPSASASASASASRALGVLTRAHPLYHSTAELDAYYLARAAEVPSLMRVDAEMEDQNENNPDASRRASPLVGGEAYPDARCRRPCQARRTLRCVFLPAAARRAGHSLTRSLAHSLARSLARSA